MFKDRLIIGDPIDDLIADFIDLAWKVLPYLGSAFFGVIIGYLLWGMKA